MHRLTPWRSLEHKLCLHVNIMVLFKLNQHAFNLIQMKRINENLHF